MVYRGRSGLQSLQDVENCHRFVDCVNERKCGLGTSLFCTKPNSSETKTEFWKSFDSTAGVWEEGWSISA